MWPSVQAKSNWIPVEKGPQSSESNRFCEDFLAFLIRGGKSLPSINKIIIRNTYCEKCKYRLFRLAGGRCGALSRILIK